MLGPFRIRNLRNHPQAQLRQFKSSEQIQASADSRPTSANDAIVCIEGERYDRIADDHPSARLQYYDEDHDIITVGSQAELSQRLSESVPVLDRARPRVSPISPSPGQPAPGYMHVFQINPIETNVKIWEEIEKQTEALMQRTNNGEKDAPRTTDKGKGHEAPESPQQDARQRYFLSTRPPILGFNYGRETVKQPGSPSVLTEAGRRQAREIGQRLQSSRRSTSLAGPESTKVNQKDAVNRWASYSTALQTAPTHVDETREIEDQAGQDFALPEGSGNENGPEQDSRTNHTFKPHGITKIQSDVRQYLPTSSRIPREEYPAASTTTDAEEAKPLLSPEPEEDKAESEPSITLLDDKLRTNLLNYTEQQLCAELTRRGIPNLTDTYQELMGYVRNEAQKTSFSATGRTNGQTDACTNCRKENAAQPAEEDPNLSSEVKLKVLYNVTESLKQALSKQKSRTEHVVETEEDIKTEKPVSDPVEVTVGKMIMQMVSSVISNLHTLNDQVQHQARTELLQEPLRLRGYPDTSAHRDDLWRDIESLKETFTEFDIATSDIRRSFERMHDHHEFPAGSGMLRLNGISNARGPLPQIATALQNLAQGITKTCIPAVGEYNGRLQYHIPRRLTTAGYEDIWELHIEPVPHWASEESFVKDFVEKSMVERGVDVTVSKIRFTPLNGAFFEIKGIENAESVLQELPGSLWCGNQVKVTMKRKLYPTVFGAKHSRGVSSFDTQTYDFDVSASGTLPAQPPKVPPKPKLDVSEKRKAIQDRRAAWRREYKARTQTVRFEDSTMAKEPADSKDSHPLSHLESRHVPILWEDEGNRGRQATEEVPHSSHIHAKPFVPESKRLSKRRSMPAVHSFGQPQIRPLSTIQSEQEQSLRRSSSLQFQRVPPPVPPKELNSPKVAGQNSQISFQQANLSHVQPYCRTDDKLEQARRVSDNFNSSRGSTQPQNDFHSVIGNSDRHGTASKLNDFQQATSNFIPYSDRDPAGYILFKPEANLARRHTYVGPSDNSRNNHSQAFIPPLTENSKAMPSFPFPPLPTMEPLVPTRAQVPAPPSKFVQRAWLRRSGTLNDRFSAGGDSIPWNATRTLFVGKIPLEADREWIDRRFGRFGTIRKVKFGNNKSSQGSCYVEFEDLKAAVRAREAMCGVKVPDAPSTLYVSFTEPSVMEQDHQEPSSESSGAFSRRMMGRSPPPKGPGVPITSPDQKPTEPSIELQVSELPELTKTQGRASPLSVETKFDFVPGRGASVDASTDTGPVRVNNPWDINRSVLSRSKTTVERDNKTPSGPWSRRPYSVNFDGAGRAGNHKEIAPVGGDPTGPAQAPVNERSTHVSDASLANGSGQSTQEDSERPKSTLFEGFNIPNNWREQSRPIPIDRPVSPIPRHDDPTTVRVIEECVAKLKDLGYGSKDDGGQERLVIVAQAAEGDLEDAIDIIEEERQAWDERLS